MKTYRQIASCLLLCLLYVSAYAQQAGVYPTPVHSESMNKDVDNLIILPADYQENAGKEYPVLFLLHGYGGNYKTWLGIKPELPKIATEKEMIIVCPDGKNSWYWDSPVNPSIKYETYVSKELISYIDKNFRTRKSPKGRAIAGLSMGGHGALWLAFRHPDVFGACGSMSGGVDIRPFPNNWEMSKSLGDYKDNPQRWNEYTVINLLPRIKPGTLSIIFDCGTEDFFYKVNEELHKQMLYYNIPHDYLSRPGAHNSNYWNNAINYQLVFFDNFFKK